MRNPDTHRGSADRALSRTPLTDRSYFAGKLKEPAINGRPRLIMFAFNTDQRDGKTRGPHPSFSEEALGHDNLGGECQMAGGTPGNMVLNKY